MWAVKNASVQLRNRGSSLRIKHAVRVASSLGRNNINSDGFVEPPVELSNHLLNPTCFFQRSFSFSLQKDFRSFSSNAGASKPGEQDDDDLEIDVSDSEKKPFDPTSNVNSDDQIGGAVYSDADFSELDDELETLADKTEGNSQVNSYQPPSGLIQLILASPGKPVREVLDEWIKEGNELTMDEALKAMIQLRRRRLYGRALQMSEWMKTAKNLEFDEKYYASHVDLIAKVRGLYSAEEYLKKIPECHRVERVYQSLLANSVFKGNVKKSEELFNRMNELFPVTIFSYNQMLVLYKRMSWRKVNDILLLMKERNVKPSTFTYQVLIDLKGIAKDISGMEQLLEEMKAEGFKPWNYLNASLAKYYINCGLTSKAEAILKEIEGEDTTKLRLVSHFLLPIYGSLGKEDEVARIWKLCEQNPRLEECIAAIEAWGKLKRIEDAELAFEKLSKISKKLASKHYVFLLKVYANNKMVDKGKDLITKMATGRERDAPQVLDAIILLYVNAGETEKAASVLLNAITKKLGKPFFISYFRILDQYSRKGDIHNAEKIFLKMRQAGYVGRIKPYLSLIHAYVNAKEPAYGFRERMKGDGVPIAGPVAGLLDRADAFRKSPIASLLV